MKKKSVAFFLGSMNRGGAERVISILSKEYADSDWDTSIVLLLSNVVAYKLHPDTKIVDFSGKRSSRILRIPMWLKSIRSYVKNEKPDVIVSFVARINILVMLACFGLKTKIILSERNDPQYDGRGFFAKLLTKILYPMADHIVFQTQRVKNQFNKRIQNNSTVIPNPICVSVCEADHKQKKIVTAGRLTAQKNHKMLINAFAEVTKKHPEYSLYIYGEGELRQELINRAEQLGISEKVFLPGNVLNIHENIADADIFVLSSDYEGLSNALLEAMMMGLPCIATNCAGSDEYIKDGVNGKLVPVNDVNAMEKAILSLIDNEEMRIEFGHQARTTSVAFSADNVMDLWHSVID